MDVDMDIEYDLDPEIARLQAGSAALNALPSAMQTDAESVAVDADADTMVEDGEVAPSEAVANKVHISGLDTLTTSDIANFASDNYDKNERTKIEWVNDHSANIVYQTNAAAAAALKAFSVTPVDDPFEERRAQSLLTHPDIQLYVRQALVTDVKVQGAAKNSAFYLRNPEYDPESRPRNRGGEGRARGGGRGGGYRHGGARDDYADRSRRSSNAEKGFSVDLYDDVKAPSAPTGPLARRQSSNEDLMAGRQQRRGSRRDTVELIENRREGRLRDRSASPTREGDGRYGFSPDQPYRQTARHRTPPPARPRSRQDSRGAMQSLREDLFANRKSASALQNGNGSVKPPVELFPSRPSTTTTELFPHKINEKRQKSADIHGAEQVLERQRPRYRADRNGGDLISHSSSSRGRLTDDYDDGASFSIKGAAPGVSKSDFSIRGASSGKMTNGGGNNDLFANRSGRSSAQRLGRS